MGVTGVMAGVERRAQVMKRNFSHLEGERQRIQERPSDLNDPEDHTEGDHLRYSMQVDAQSHNMGMPIY